MNPFAHGFVFNGSFSNPVETSISDLYSLHSRLLILNETLWV